MGINQVFLLMLFKSLTDLCLVQRWRIDSSWINSQFSNATISCFSFNM